MISDTAKKKLPNNSIITLEPNEIFLKSTIPNIIIKLIPVDNNLGLLIFSPKINLDIINKKKVPLKPTRVATDNIVFLTPISHNVIAEKKIIPLNRCTLGYFTLRYSLFISTKGNRLIMEKKNLQHDISKAGI